MARKTTGALSAKLTQDSERYTREADEIRGQAQQRDAESEHAEARALQFDFSEGLLELGLVMSSLYFLSRRWLFVGFGAASAASGMLLGIVGWLS